MLNKTANLLKRKVVEVSGNQLTTYLGLIIVSVIVIGVVIETATGAVSDLSGLALAKIKTVFGL